MAARNRRSIAWHVSLFIKNEQWGRWRTAHDDQRDVGDAGGIHPRGRRQRPRLREHTAVSLPGGQEGGAAFLVVYLLFVHAVGVPAMLVEFVIGRATERNPVGALRELASGAWQYLGWMFFATGSVILSYHGVGPAGR